MDAILNRAKSIRTFIGAKNYEESINFYRDIGFEAFEIGDKMTFFRVNEQLGFYLQDYYVKDWVNNSMVFLEVVDLDEWKEVLMQKGLDKKYKTVRFSEIKNFEWGRELFMHDPSGILWHFGQFNS